MKSLISHEYRCSCGKLLFKGMAFTSMIEIKCRSCGKINQISGMLGEPIEDRQNCFTYLLDRQGIIKDVSESIEKILGYSVGEVMGKSIFEFSQKTNREAYTRIYDSLVSSNSDVFCQVNPVYRSKKGEDLKFKVSFRVFKNGEEKLLFCVADLSSDDYQYHSAEIDKAKEVDILCEIYCEISPEMIVVHAGGHGGGFLGYGGDETIGKKIFEFIAPREIQKTYEFHQEAIKREQFFRMQGLKMIKKGGEYEELDLYFTPNYNDAGKFVGYKIMGWLSKKE